MTYCEDCGCKVYSGICSNCHEELYIATFQAEYMVDYPSREFIEKANESERVLKEKKKYENLADN